MWSNCTRDWNLASSAILPVHQPLLNTWSDDSLLGDRPGPALLSRLEDLWWFAMRWCFCGQIRHICCNELLGSNWRLQHYWLRTTDKFVSAVRMESCGLCVQLMSTSCINKANRVLLCTMLGCWWYLPHSCCHVTDIASSRHSCI